MLCTKAENPSLPTHWPAAEKETAVWYLCMRTHLPTAAPFPELLDNKEQKSCTLIYALQRTAGFEKSCQHLASFWAGSPRGLLWSPCPCTLLCFPLCQVIGSDLEHSKYCQVFLQMPRPHHLHHDDNIVWGQGNALCAVGVGGWHLKDQTKWPMQNSRCEVLADAKRIRLH